MLKCAFWYRVLHGTEIVRNCYAWDADASKQINTNQKKAYRNIAYDINTVQSAPGTITDQEIVFRVPFDTIPIVIVSIESSTTNANYGKITAFVDNRSKTGFTLRLANASENNLTPAIAWVAIAK